MNMLKNDIYLELSNKAQIDWWNKIGGRLVKIIHVETIVRTDTNDPIAYLIWVKDGLFKKFVVSKMRSF